VDASFSPFPVVKQSASSTGAVDIVVVKQQYSITRGYSLKLVNNRYHYDLRKFSFAPKIVNVWNSLPQIVISADTTDT